MSEGLRNADGGGSGRAACYTFSDGLITYKRKKLCSTDSSVSSGDQKAAERECTTCNGADDIEGHSRIQHHWKKVLQRLLLSQDVNDDVVSHCIQRVLLSDDSSSSFVNRRVHSTQPGFVQLVNGTLCNEAKRSENFQVVPPEHKEATLSVFHSSSTGQMGDCDISKDCEKVLMEILASEKFASLCDLLLGKLPGIKVESLLDFNGISSKMKSRAHGHSIGLLHQDLQQMWERIREIGQELGLLATSLSNISTDYCHRQMGNPLGTGFHEQESKKHHGNGADEKNSTDSHTTSQFPCNSDRSTKLEQTEASYPYKVSICMQDEDVPDVPFESEGRTPLHQDCMVCDKLKSSGLLLEPTKNEVEGKEEGEENSRESSISTMDSDGLPEPARTAQERLCKLCGTHEEHDKRFITCDHSLCIYKYYHIRCLKSHQVARQHHKHGGWYCPSCLCRGCLVDKDDELIVMCDGCDEGYHIYCMEPPLSSVPKGKWFCISCNMQRAKQGMRRYEQWVLTQHTQSEENLSDGSNRPMDLLLSAAEKVEKLAAGRKGR